MTISKCPGCHIALDLSAIAVGQQVACPRCGISFVAPGDFEPPPVAPPDIPQFDAAREMQRTSLTTGRAVSERPTTLADLFDFSFNRYVTPLIVKITWMLALLLAGMWLLMTVVLIAASLVPDRSETVQQDASEPEIRLEFGSSQPIDRLAEHVDEAWDATAWRIAMLVTQVIGAVLFLLWMRVALESVIVIFNIAASLRSIDRKTKSG